MIQLSICVILVPFLIYVKSNEETNNLTYSTRIIDKNGVGYTCPFVGDIEVTDGDMVTVETNHSAYIDLAVIQLPPHYVVNITEADVSNHRKIKKMVISPEMNGLWTISTLTNPGATVVTMDNLNIATYNKETYYQFSCKYHIKVLPKPAPKEDNKILPKPAPKEDDKTWMYFVIGGSLLAVIIVVQTIVILYILKTKKIRRIEQLAMSNNTRNASDTARYSTMPARLPSVKVTPDEDAGSIYECLDPVLNPENDAPPPPPIDTLPRPTKKDKKPSLTGSNSQVSTPNMSRAPPMSEEDRIRCRPPMPIPSDTENPITGTASPARHPRTESNVSVRTHGPEKLQPSSFSPSNVVPAPTRPAPKMTRKPSAVNQDSLSNELSNILKKRQMGNIPPKPYKPPGSVPETMPKPHQGLKPPTMPKAATPSQQVPRPGLSKTVAGLPKSQPTQPPPLTPKPLANRYPVDPPTPQHPFAPPPVHGHAPQRYPNPHQQVPGQRPPMPPRPLPVMPADDQEEPEYADYDDEEWTYEALPPYNIYSS